LHDHVGASGAAELEDKETRSHAGEGASETALRQEALHR
jgi:hypothetical protein